MSWVCPLGPSRLLTDQTQLTLRAPSARKMSWTWRHDGHVLRRRVAVDVDAPRVPVAVHLVHEADEDRAPVGGDVARVGPDVAVVGPGGDAREPDGGLVDRVRPAGRRVPGLPGDHRHGPLLRHPARPVGAEGPPAADPLLEPVHDARARGRGPAARPRPPRAARGAWRSRRRGRPRCRGGVRCRSGPDATTAGFTAPDPPPSLRARGTPIAAAASPIAPTPMAAAARPIRRPRRPLSLSGTRFCVIGSGSLSLWPRHVIKRPG